MALNASAYRNGHPAATGYENASLAASADVYRVQGRCQHFAATTSGLHLSLPDARTLTVGHRFKVYVTGANTVEVRDGAGGSMANVAPGHYHRCYLAENSTAAGKWICTTRVADPSFLFPYLFGGDGSNPDSTYKYDPVANAWTSALALPDIGTSVWSFGAAFPLGGVGYIAGGTPAAETEARKYSPGGGGSWSAIDDMPRAHTATMGDSVEASNVGYVTGGNSASATNEQIERMDIDGTWTSESNSRGSLLGSANGAAAQSRGRLWVMNGFRTSVGYTNTVASFNPADGTWTEESVFDSFPSPLRRFIGATTVSEDVYVTGGNNSTSYYQDCEKCDTSGGPLAISWSSVADFSVSGRGQGGTTWGTDRVYYMGGSDASTRYDDVVELDTVGGAWSALADLPEAKDECSNQAVTLQS